MSRYVDLDEKVTATYYDEQYEEWDHHTVTIEDVLNEVCDDYTVLPSVEPTLYGYKIEYLELIARILEKENLSPERVVEALTDIGRIVAIVADEFKETLKKAVDQCVT